MVNVLKKTLKSVGSRSQVFRGTAKKTPGGLTKSQLVKSNGRIRTKKGVKKGKTNSWAASMKKARAKLMKSGVIGKKSGFIAMNKGKEGVALYKETKNIYSKN